MVYFFLSYWMTEVVGFLPFYVFNAILYMYTIHVGVLAGWLVELLEDRNFGKGLEIVLIHKDLQSHNR